MKLKTRLLSLLLCAVLLCGMIPTASAYSGVAQWFEPSLREMQELDLLPASFTDMNLSRDITRGEMCQLAVHALEKIVGWSIDPERADYFSDTQELYIVKAYELGIVNGYPDGTFRPDAKLTRQEFFQIIENFCNAAAFLPFADNSFLSSFLDTDAVADWAAEATQICVKYGYVNGKTTQDGVVLDPTGNASRQEAMAMFLRAYKSLNEYYYYILNANVVIDDIQTPDKVETGNNTVIEDVEITGVDMHMMVNTSGLNVRSLWSKESDVLGVVSYGADLTVTGLCANGWVQILYKGQTGYVNGDYVEEYKQVDHTANATAPQIPEGVTDMAWCFNACSALTSAPELPDAVQKLTSTFRDCVSLTEAPQIPAGVTRLSSMFEGCTNLSKVNVTIPESVEEMDRMFYSCANLSGTVTINAEPIKYTHCFYWVDFSTQDLTLTGSSSLLRAIGNTGKNYPG